MSSSRRGFVNFLAPGGVVDLDISALLFAPGRGLPAHPENVGLAGLWLEHGNPDLFAQGGELLDSSRALKIARDQQRRFALGFQPAGEFGATMSFCPLRSGPR